MSAYSIVLARIALSNDGFNNRFPRVVLFPMALHGMVLGRTAFIIYMA